MNKLSTAVNVGNAIGKGFATFRFVIATLVCIVIFSVGSYLYKMKNKFSSKAEAKITKAECESYKATERNGNSSTQVSKYRCDNVVYTFSVDGEDYTNSFNSDSKKNYVVGQTLKIEYVPENPSENRRESLDLKFVGKMMMIGAIVLFVLSFLFLYFILNVRGAGSVYTVASAINAVKPSKKGNNASTKMFF